MSSDSGNQKEREEFNKICNLLMECCKLNNISPINFYGAASTIMARHMKITGSSKEIARKVVECMAEAIYLEWETI